MTGISSHTLFEISLFQREPEYAEATARKELWEYKTFGFFDVLQFRPLTGTRYPRPQRRHERTLLAYGDLAQVKDLLQEANGGKCYLAVGLIKLDGIGAHEDYSVTMRRLVGRRWRHGVVLGCLDAADLIVLKTFKGRFPMRQLVRWMKDVRVDPAFGASIERKLTMVACKSLDSFIHYLAERDPMLALGKASGSSARALMRITDRRNGRGVSELRRRLREENYSRVATQLRACAGYYDVQGVISIPEAAKVLNLAKPLVEAGLIATSTSFIGVQANPGRMEASLPSGGGHGPRLYRNLVHAGRTVKARFEVLAPSRCVTGNLKEAVDTVLEQFRQLNGSGFVPGSRLLLWASLDGLRCFNRDCLELMRRLRSRRRVGAVESFHFRQRDYAEFFRAISEELDRRVSLSLPAYTRYFPCAIKAPLKVVGALDVASRLVATSFRAYRCRENTRLLQVFSAKAGKPAYFRPSRIKRGNSPASGPTMTVTTLSPAMLEHFHLALFSVFHESAQCVLEGTLANPNFTALVHAQAKVERLAALTSLVAAGTECQSVTTVPDHVWDWTVNFLGTELGQGRWVADNYDADESYFLKKKRSFSRKERRVRHNWLTEGLFRQQLVRWAPVHVEDGPDAFKHCYLLRRDAIAANWLDVDFSDTQARYRWSQELHNHFAVSEPANGGGPSQLQVQSWRVPAENRAKPGRYALDLDWCDAQLDYAEQIFPAEELLELASLVPFLRLFENDANPVAFQAVLAGLVTEYFEVWRDWADWQQHRVAARRFVVAAAALRLFCEQRRSQRKLNRDAVGTAADRAIQRGVRQAADALMRKVRLREGELGHEIFYALWKVLRGDHAGEPETLRMAQDCHPLIMNAMVRYLVRLLHVYQTKGEHVSQQKRRDLHAINRFLRSLFVRPGSADGLPVDSVARLWACQYRLTRDPEAESKFSTVANAAESVRNL